MPVYHPRYTLLDRIRTLIYKVGLRPKPGSIFFSPSRAFYIAVDEAFKEPLFKRDLG